MQATLGDQFSTFIKMPEMIARVANSLDIGIAINFTSNPNSTKINAKNKTLLDWGGNHRKYSINNVIIKYNKPKVENKINPLISSFK